MSQLLLIDPSISRRKFNRELDDLNKILPDMRKQGWILEEANFPIVRVTFLITSLQPPVALLTVELDFTNYNLVPPSVKFLNPVNFEPIDKRYEALQKTRDGERNILIYSHPLTKLPFLCLPGIQEYHSHPQHNGDSWDLYRYIITNSLFFIINNIWLSFKWINAFRIDVILQLQDEQKQNLTVLSNTVLLSRTNKGENDGK